MDSNCAGISGTVSDLFLVSEYYVLSVHVLEVHIQVYMYARQLCKLTDFTGSIPFCHTH